jgi:hypothetical protein
MEGLPPVFQTPPRTLLRRNYHYNISFTVTDTLGIRETTGQELFIHPELSMYPNPVSEGKISIETGNYQGPVKVIVVDMQGRMLYSEESADRPIRINSDLLPGPGTYIVRMECELGVVHGKLVKTTY